MVQADNIVRTNKKKARKQIATTLEVALAPMKEVWSQKQFRNRIKKASKVLATGISKKTGLPLELASNKIVLTTEANGTVVH